MTLADEVARNFGVNNYYQVLRLPNDATASEIRKAYLERSLELHPDRIADPDQQNEFKCKFQILSEIYKILTDTSKREEYDSQLRLSERSLGEVEDSTIHEVIPLVSCNELDDIYSYVCRCSGQFIVPKQNLTALASISEQNQQNVFIVDCDSCSASIKITL